MKTINELLARWAELEPIMCSVSYPYDTCEKAYHIPCFPGNGIAGKTVSFCADWEYEYSPRLWELQGAVQQAVESRGWNWEIYASIENHTSMWEARVYSGTWKVEYVFRRDPDSPAHALLAAYIKALEAVAEVA